MSTVIGFRVTDKQRLAVSKISEATATSASEIIRSCLPSAELADVLIAESELERTSVGDALAGLIAEALKMRMAYELDSHFIDGLVDPRAIVAEYARFQDATGDGREYYLAKPPAGGEWHRRGIVGNILLARGERLTPDGIERVLS